MLRITSTLRKETRLTIKSNFKRYLSLITIIFLGVSFYVGMKSNSPILKNTMIKYFDDYNYSDINILSNDGFSENDLMKLKYVIDRIDLIEGKYYMELISQVYNHQNDEYDNKVFAINSYSKDDRLNKLKLLQGRNIKNENECVLDASITGLGYKLGDKITFSSPSLKNKEYNIVGFARSPKYISVNRGSSTLLDGKINYFAYVKSTNFVINSEYNAIDIKLDNRYKQFTNKYSEYIEKIKKKIILLQYKQGLSWNVSSRNDSPGYSNYYDDVLRSEKLARFFPLMFFIVAILVTTTSVARIVQEERRKIGILKSLGYNKKQLMYKYIYYATSASIIGIILGIKVGISFFPKLMLKIYTLQYFIPDLIYEFEIKYILIATLFAFVSTTITAYLTIKNVFKEKTAELMKNKNVGMNRTSLFEKNEKIWSKLPFHLKITLRNMFQRKTRSFMAIIGIAGCTALMIIGFGFLESIEDIITRQYTRILNISSEFFYNSDMTQDQINEDYVALSKLNYVKQASLNKFETVEVKYKNKTHTIYSITPDKTSDFNNAINLYSILDNKKIDLEKQDGIVLTEKIANLLNVSKGDKITFNDNLNKSHTVLVSDIAENYVFHYMYMNKKTYEKIYEDDYKSNVILLKYNSNKKADYYNEKIFNDTKYVNFVSIIHSKEDAKGIISRFNLAIYIIVISAGLLAFVVLYNFSKINLSERSMEVATLKTMGCKPSQINKYINYEASSLTILGIILGLFMGRLLTLSMIKTCEVDNMMFYHGISYVSYAYSILLTLLFAKIINLFIRKDIRKISMTDAFKYIE